MRGKRAGWVASSTALTAALVLAGCSDARPAAEAPGTTALPSDEAAGDGGSGGSTAAPNDPAAVPASPRPSRGSAADGVDGGGVELPADNASESGLPGLSAGTSVDRSPLVSLPLPVTASAKGRLVRGYPATALPATRHSRIDSTSVSSGDSQVQVALVATTDRSAAAVLRFYRLHLTGLGFRERPATAAGGSEAAAFRRGSDVVTVTVTPTRTGTSYSVFGTLHAGS